MASSGPRAAATLGTGLALAAGGALFTLAWQAGLWASSAGAILIVLWIAGLGGWSALRQEPALPDAAPAAEALPLRLLLDQLPVPLVSVDAEGPRALNRAARSLFATDDRIMPAPAALTGAGMRLLRQAGRRWRIDAVEGARGGRLIALIDIETEERAAQERAADEMIDILGHELLNGLSPVVSLADSAITAAAANDAALPDILATLARRVEGLEGFTRAYRQLARLPDPVRAPVPLDELADDLARLFDARFGTAVALVRAVPADLVAPLDRDQMTQAIWALLQNGAEAAAANGGDAEVRLAIACEAGVMRVVVSDSGAGVAAPERGRIFRPFHTTKPNGSGVGLSLARRIARAHDGDVVLDDHGITTFRLHAAL